MRAAQRSFWALLTLLCLDSCGATATTLRILHTNDIHSHLLPFVTTTGDTLGGVARLAMLLQRERSAAPASLYVDAGDLFQGTPFYNFFKGEPELRVLSALGCDVMAMGNHELDDGPASLLRQVRHHATFPILCANVSQVHSDSTEAAQPLLRRTDLVMSSLFPSHVVLNRGDLTIGLIGIVTDDLVNIVVKRHMAGLHVSPAASAIRNSVAALLPRTDVIIVLSHSGLQADSILAMTVPGIDVVVSGHDHKAVPEPILVRNPATKNGIGGTLLVETGDWGRNLGRLDLQVENGQVIGWNGTLLPVTVDIPADTDIAVLVNGYAARLEEHVSRIVATAAVPLPADHVLVNETALGNLIADLIRDEARTDIAFQNGGGIRSSINRGPIRQGDVYSVLPFENTIVKVRLSGAQVEAFCREMIAKRGRGGFGPVSGLTFEARNGEPRSIRVLGKPLDRGRSYTMAINSFTAGGGDGYKLFRQGSRYEDTGVLLRDAFQKGIEKVKTVSPKIEGRVRLLD
jgi:5'-nucleotidase / UDP-sugar diphosphatase